MQIGMLIPLWRASLESDHAASTVDSYVAHVAHFAAHLGSTAETDMITHRTIEAYKRQRAARCNAKTIGLALTSIRSFCRYLIASELRADDPTLKVTFPRAPKSLPRALARSQVRELVAAVAVPSDLHPQGDYQWRRNRLIIFLMLYSGLRISEVWALRWRDVQIEQRRLMIRAAKGAKDRVVPMHTMLVGELRLASIGRRERDAVCGHAHGPCLSAKSMHHVFERWVPRLRLSFHFTPHQLRHTFITELIDHGANIFEAQELAGHESPETTRIYYRLSAEHLRHAIDRLPSAW
ncbi:MAG: tyrosine-type recombinase/integrase [Chloroflexota bacterium]|nr:tyrosine-type recombinase/integrase [Chloroflexota bacterium]